MGNAIAKGESLKVSVRDEPEVFVFFGQRDPNDDFV